MIASDVTDLESLSPPVAVAALMEDLCRYLPKFSPDDVEYITFQSHSGQPLFMNDVGGWAFRPGPRTQVKNLYLAGDYCQTPIDLVSMEGATFSGLNAAEAIRSDLGIDGPIAMLLPPVHPRWLLVLGKLALLPFAAAAKLWALLSGAHFDPATSDVPSFDLSSLPKWPVRVIDESN